MMAASLPKFRVRSSQPVRVGILAPMTGDASTWGRPGYQGCRIWADSLNAEGGIRIGNHQHPVEIVAHDDEYDPAKALQGAKDLIERMGVKILLTLGGNTLPEINDYITEKKMLTTTLLPSDLSPDTPYLIAPCEVHPIYVVTGVEWLAETHPDLKTVAMCAQTDAMGLPSLATYKAAFEAKGIAIVKEIRFPGDESDMDSIVESMLQSDPDILCWDTAYEPFVHALTEAAYRRGFKGKIISCTADNYPGLIEKTSKEFLEGFVFQFPDFDDPALSHPSVNFSNPNQFYHDFNRRFPGEWSAVSWIYCSILEMWRRAVERIETDDPVAVLSAIKEGGYSTNVFGEARWWGRDLFGINHALVGSWPVVKITDGKAAIVEFRSILDWWDTHSELLIKHMRSYGQMWDQRLDRDDLDLANVELHTPRIRSL